MDFNKLNRGDLNNLQNQDLDFDKEAMWANLEKGNKRRPVFWWWIGGLGLALTLLGAFFLLNENSDLKNTNTQITDYQEIVKEKAIINEVRTEINKKTSALQNPTNSEKKTIENFDVEKENKSNTPTDLKSNNSTFKIINSNGHGENYSRNQREKFAKSLVLKNDKKLVSNNFSNRKVAIGSLDEFTVAKNESLVSLPFLDIKKAFLKLEKEEISLIANVDVSEIKRRKSANLLLSTFAGIGYQTRMLEMKEGPNSSEELTQRTSIEKLHESRNFGLLIEKNLGEHLMLGTGFEFLQHNEQLTLNEYETDNIEGFSFAEIPNDFIGQEGFLTKRTSFIYQNQYRLLNIPLSVSWMLNSKKLRLAPNVSLVFNITQKANGHIVNERGVAEDVALYFKSQVGLAYRLGCRMYYPLNNRFLLFANPQFEINPNDVSSSLNPISQKRNLVKLDIGITRQLNW